MNEILLCVGARKMKIKDLESYDDHLPWRENQTVDDIRKLLFDCLSDKCWCKISWGKTYIYTGYELYVYVSVPLEYDKITAICQKYSLYCETEFPK